MHLADELARLSKVCSPQLLQVAFLHMMRFLVECDIMGSEIALYLRPCVVRYRGNAIHSGYGGQDTRPDLRSFLSHPQCQAKPF